MSELILTKGLKNDLILVINVYGKVALVFVKNIAEKTVKHEG